eukprot:1137474-Pelagomonas_calceolata.AAC.3
MLQNYGAQDHPTLRVSSASKSRCSMSPYSQSLLRNRLHIGPRGAPPQPGHNVLWGRSCAITCG